jgi:hypothetical protein
VQQQRVYVMDANAYTSQSGPRLVCGLEIFAEILRPECFSTLIPAGGAGRLSAEQLKAPAWPDQRSCEPSPPYRLSSSGCANSGDLKTVLAMCMKARAGSTPI